MADSAAATARQLSEVDWANWQADDVATLVYVIRDERMLLMRKLRGLGAGKINAPGGKLDPGETLEQCARRETHEELRIRVGELDYCGDNRFQFTDGYKLHAHVFRATDFSGEPSATEEAIPHWFDLDSIPYGEMWEDDYLWVPRVIRGESFRGRWLFDGDRMLDYLLEDGG